MNNRQKASSHLAALISIGLLGTSATTYALPKLSFVIGALPIIATVANHYWELNSIPAPTNTSHEAVDRARAPHSRSNAFTSTTIQWRADLERDKNYVNNLRRNILGESFEQKMMGAAIFGACTWGITTLIAQALQKKVPAVPLLLDLRTT